jgi:transcriptional regulator with XRE-family HTH domain
MLNTQITAERIKIQAKQKGLSVKKLLENCDLGVNTVTKMSNGTDVVSQNLLKIAEYLNVSTDYLLGRTDNPDINTNIRTGDVSGVNINGNTNTNVNIGTPSKEQDTADLVELIEDLPLVKRAKVITYIDEMKKED